MALSAAQGLKPPYGHTRLLFSKSDDGKGADGSKNRLHDACPVLCRVPGDYGPCSERVRVFHLKKAGNLKNWPRVNLVDIGAERGPWVEASVWPRKTAILAKPGWEGS